jgi:hypothetical protein
MKNSKERYASLDMELDGEVMDIRSITGRGWYSNALRQKNDQIRKFNERPDITTKADSVCLYFHDPKLFSDIKMRKTINRYLYTYGPDGKRMEIYIKNIYVVINGQKNILKYSI